MTTTDWLLLGVIVAVLAHAFVGMVDGHAMVAQMGQIRDALHRIRTELENLKKSAEKP